MKSAAALWLIFLMPFASQSLGVFYDGYQAENRGVGMNIAIVHDGPRCRALKNCAWMVMWSAKRYTETAEIAVTVAGKDAPALVAIVPGGKNSRLDQHNPVFDIPLASVSGIEFILRNGIREVGRARFPVEQRKAAK